MIDGWIKVTSCPFCKGELQKYESVATAPYIRAEFIGGMFQFATVSHFLKCPDCGLIVQSPRVTDERLKLYYSEGLYRATLGISQEESDADELQRAEELAAWLPFVPKSHLDIGCSRGYFLRATREKGAEIMGVEPAEGYTVSDVPICSSIPDAPYHLVSLIHVLEHEGDPFALLKEAAKRAEEWILVEVPGDDCLGGPLRFAHLYQFPTTVLVKMVQDAGFTIDRVMETPNVRILARTF